MSTFTIHPRGRFELQAPIEFLQGFIPAGERGMQPEGHLHLAFPLDGTWHPVGICLQQDAAGVHGTVYGEADVDAVKAQTERILSLNYDGTAYEAIGQRDPVVGKLQEARHFLRPVLFYSPYEAAVWAIISARVSMRQAARTKTQLATMLGTTVDVHGHRLPTFPPPRRLLELEGVPGLFGRKLEYLHAMATEVISGRLEASRLLAMRGDDAIDYLQTLPGIGPFAADHTLLRGAGEPDRLTTHGPRVLAAVAWAYGLPAEPALEAFTRLAEAWKPFRTWVMVLLRASVPHEPVDFRGKRKDRHG